MNYYYMYFSIFLSVILFVNKIYKKINGCIFLEFWRLNYTVKITVLIDRTFNDLNQTNVIERLFRKFKNQFFRRVKLAREGKLIKT